MLSQVSGRAGRRSKQGKVIIQTYDVKHRIIKQIVENDYEGMYKEEMIERKQFKYPPYHKIIHIDLKHKDLGKLLLMADNFGKLLRHHLGEMVLGPQSPLIGRIRNYYIQTIIIKMDWTNQSVLKIKSLIKEKISDFELDKINTGIFIQVDVDPY
jgi:primosomal protein N' (replication factor Y)